MNYTFRMKQNPGKVCCENGKGWNWLRIMASGGL